MNKIFLLLFLTSLTSCDPIYKLYIYNESKNDVLIKTIPAIESLPISKHFVQMIKEKYKVADEGELSVYKLKPGDTVQLYSGLGISPKLEDFPLNKIQLVSKHDTITMSDKTEIFNTLIQRADIQGKRDYYIRVHK